MAYQVRATLQNPQFDEAVAILKKYGISAHRDVNSGRIACYENEEDAKQILQILQREMPSVHWIIVEVAMPAERQMVEQSPGTPLRLHPWLNKPARL